MSQQLSISGATHKLDTWKPQTKPDEECHAYRELVKQVVFAKWGRRHEPITLEAIYSGFRDDHESVKGVKALVEDRIREGMWPFPAYPRRVFCRSKRFVDRRVNEVASDKFAGEGLVKVVAVSSGIYAPNPELFELPRLKSEDLRQ